MGKQIAIAPGTRVSLAWETVAGTRPTTGYVLWDECTSTPDFNNSRDQIETTTLLQENNHTYTAGLRDFGDLEFGSNLTDDVLDLFIGTNGYVTKYPDKIGSGLNLWICVDSKALSKSYFVPVEPQDFAMPGLEAGSNKADLVVRFTAVGDAVWGEEPVYSTDTTHFLTLESDIYSVNYRIIQGNNVVRSVSLSAEENTIELELPEGTYTVIGSAESYSSIAEDVLLEDDATVTFTFNE